MKKWMKTILLACLVFSLGMGGALAAKGDVLLGDEQFEEYLPILEGKRVALFSNHTGIVGDETSETGEADVNRLFGLDAAGEPLSYGTHILDALLEPPFMDEVCFGEDLRGVPIEEIWEAGINLDYLIRAYNACMQGTPQESFWGSPDGQGRYWIDLLSGSAELRTMVEAGMSAEEIKAAWQDDIAAFKAQRKPYLLYEE